MEVICSQGRTVILAHASTKAGSRSRRDLALTTRITAVEFANLEHELNSLSSTGGIAHSAVIVALDGGRHDRAEGTTRRGMRCNGCDDQTVFGDFYLIDQHPFGKGK
jgi:hypothetical protein